MSALVRLLHWLLVWYSAQLFAPDGSRFAFYGLIALIPPCLAWWTEEYGSRGIGNAGPSRSQVVVLASLESVAGVLAASLGLWVPPLLAVSALVLVVCGAVGVAFAIKGSVRVESGNDGLHIRQAKFAVVYPWESLRLRRRGRTLWFQSGGKQVAARFGLARGEELRGQIEARGVPFVDEASQDASLAPAFAIGVVAALLPMLLTAR